MYTHDWVLSIQSRFKRVTVHYVIPYMPAEGDRDWDEDDRDHLKYIENGKSIYSTKYRGTGAWYYLLRDLNGALKEYARYIDVSCVVPIASSKELVYKFAERMKEHVGCRVIDCLERIGESTYKLKEGVHLPEGNILLVDDVTTSGEAIENAINCLLGGYELSLDEIKVLCIGKTERDFNQWDLSKEELNLN